MTTYDIDVTYYKLNTKKGEKEIVTEHYKNSVTYEVLSQGFLWIRKTGTLTRPLPGSFDSGFLYIRLDDIIDLQITEHHKFANRAERQRWCEDAGFLETKS